MDHKEQRKANMGVTAEEIFNEDLEEDDYNFLQN